MMTIPASFLTGVISSHRPSWASETLSPPSQWGKVLGLATSFGLEGWVLGRPILSRASPPLSEGAHLLP
jgi:hypothetical protein